MITIYLDKQVFSHLFNAREEKYSLLREKILSHKDEFIFFYSNAHLFDLQDDKTDIKYAEMEFMQSIVDGNRLIYEFPRQEVMKQSPREAFETVGKVGDFSWLDNFDVSQLTDEQLNAIKFIRDLKIGTSTCSSFAEIGILFVNQLKSSSPFKSLMLISTMLFIAFSCSSVS